MPVCLGIGRSARTQPASSPDLRGGFDSFASSPFAKSSNELCLSVSFHLLGKGGGGSPAEAKSVAGNVGRGGCSIISWVMPRCEGMSR